MRLVAHCNDSRMRLGDATGFILVFGHAVNDRGLFVLRGQVALPVNRAYDVDLIILPGLVALVDVDDVVGVVDAKDWVGGVPVDVVTLLDGLEAVDDTATE